MTRNSARSFFGKLKLRGTVLLGESGSRGIDTFEQLIFWEFRLRMFLLSVILFFSNKILLFFAQNLFRNYFFNIYKSQNTNLTSLNDLERKFTEQLKNK